MWTAGARSTWFRASYSTPHRSWTRAIVTGAIAIASRMRTRPRVNPDLARHTQRDHERTRPAHGTALLCSTAGRM
eukprot:3605519-Prymnesium_polylepis.1